MGLGFSIDTPIKVAHFGIDSVISIIDDDLIEKMRKFHCKNFEVPYEAISTKEEDYRAKRITAYLNLVNDIVQANFNNLKNSFGEKGGALDKYIDMLPDDSELKLKYDEAVANKNLYEIEDLVLSQLRLGSIDVNIMTKVDKPNYNKDEQLPVRYNDAHASLRGFANSILNSSIVLSAGLNPRLYSYFEEFEDFFPNENGELNKKIILKVSDYRSAIIQGKFLAKKGLWISEYRIESGLNCGGHAFATDGYLMGPILEEFKQNRESLVNTLHEIYIDALKKKNKVINKIPRKIKITAQGGVGTFDEQNFLLDHFQVDSVGWGTPFLLVPEATNVDQNTLSLLINATEDDLYLSRISPLGVPFNSIKGNTKDIEKLENALNGKPGSSCPKKYLQSNTEFSNKPICTASQTYQSKKIDQLKSQNLDSGQFEAEYKKIIDKACLCVGLATSALKKNSAAEKLDGEGVLICPGPNLAYFSSIVTLKEMIDHIYGRINIIHRKDRPNMFMKELKLYLNYLKDEIAEEKGSPSVSRLKYFDTFQSNISDGIEYYKNLFSSTQNKIIKIESTIQQDIIDLENEFELLKEQMNILNLLPVRCEEFSNSSIEVH
jgi:hypothetical protein